MIFDKQRKHAGIRPSGRRLTPHCLRHTLATLLVQRPKWSLKDVQTHMRHRSISTTARYLHSSKKRITMLMRADPPLASTAPNYFVRRQQEGLKEIYALQGPFTSS